MHFFDATHTSVNAAPDALAPQQSRTIASHQANLQAAVPPVGAPFPILGPRVRAVSRDHGSGKPTDQVSPHDT